MTKRRILLTNAFKNKNDEFYTPYEVVENEMSQISSFFETKGHFLVVQVIFVKRSDVQQAGRDKVILNISHASRVPDNRIRSSL